MEELKPCPFCGEKPEKRFYFTNDYFFRVSISCKKCHTSKEVSLFLDNGYSYLNPSGKFIETEEKAVKKWNQRANDG